MPKQDGRNMTMVIAPSRKKPADKTTDDEPKE